MDYCMIFFSGDMDASAKEAKIEIETEMQQKRIDFLEDHKPEYGKVSVLTGKCLLSTRCSGFWFGMGVEVSKAGGGLRARLTRSQTLH
jgi:hypothetical protein